MKRFWPSTMAGQILAIVALALFAAQLVNFIWLYRASQHQEVTQNATAAVFRIAARLRDRDGDGLPGIEMRGDRGFDSDRNGRRDGRRGWGGRLLMAPASLLPVDAPRYARIEERTFEALNQNGITVRQVQIARFAVLPPGLEQALPRKWRQRPWNRRWDQSNGFIVVAIADGEGRWWHSALPVRDRDGPILWQLLLQTLILTVMVLIPLIWFTRRLSRPLARLTDAAEAYRPGRGEQIMAEGPPDTRRLIAAFNSMQGRVDAMIEEKDVMLGAIGHDLRTPLAALRVRVESVESEAERDKMVAGIEEIDQMLDDILSLARVGKTNAEREVVDLSALVATLAAEYDDMGQPVDYTEAPRTVALVRETMLRRALRNLISNALKYGGSAKLSVEARNGMVAIHVDDNGPGLPETALSRMFEPFQRAEQSRNRATGGSGLGLTIARAVARDHGGDVELVNRDGRGMRATLTLPVHAA